MIKFVACLNGCGEGYEFGDCILWKYFLHMKNIFYFFHIKNELHIMQISRRFFRIKCNFFTKQCKQT